MSKQAREVARERARAMREEQARHERRRERIVRIGVVVAVLAVVVGIGVAVQSQRTKVDPTADRPAGVSSASGGVPFGKASAPVKVDLWEDFQCPACKAFEGVNSAALEKEVDSGRVGLTIHPLTFIDNNLRNNSSAPAANAFGCAVTYGDQGKALALHRLLYQKQPKENPGADAWSTDDLIGYAKQVGVTGSDFESCVRDGRYDAWVKAVGAASANAGVSSTPTVFINGTKVADSELTKMFQGTAALQQAITDAAKG